MSRLNFQETLMVQKIDGPALANTTTPTSILAAAAKYLVPANFFEIGRKLVVKAHGRISNIVTTPGTLTLDLRLGAIVIANGGAMALNVVAKTNVPWSLIWEVICRAEGATANCMHQGEWRSESVIGALLPSVGGVPSHMLPNAAPAVGSNFDSGAAAVLDLFGAWSIANAGNSIQVHGFELISPN